MKPNTRLKTTLVLFLLFGIACSAIPISSGMANPFRDVPISGTIVYGPSIDVSVNPLTVIGKNSLSLGFMLDGDWKSWRDNPLKRQLAQEAGFKLVRFFTYKSSSPRPCSYWNETTGTGVWDWADVDLLVQRIFEIQAEPLVCLGGCGSSGIKGAPLGMSIDSTTGLPFPQDWAAYCLEWVRHFEQLGLPVKFYEIINEPQGYFAPGDWNTPDMTKLGYFTELFNAAATQMYSEEPNLVISHDFICHKPVLNYWLTNGIDVGSLNFHKYDDYRYPYYTDDQMLGFAESKFFGPWPLGGYSVTAAQQAYLNSRGKLLPIIDSESNLNGKWQDGTDPRIQQMVGATWLALVLRMSVLNNVSYHIYYSFSSSRSYEEGTLTGGFGFGMINSDDNQPWFPYYVSSMLSRNIAVDDSIVEVASSSEDVRTLGWRHNQTLNVLIICKSNQTRTVNLLGLQGELNVSRIDDGVPWQNPSIQNQVINSGTPLILHGYSVVLVQAAV